MKRSLDEFRQLSIRQLANRVFTCDSSAADEKYFRQAIYELVTGTQPAEASFRQFLWLRIYERNDEGRTCKYLHFNDHTQRLSVDWAFQAWAERVCDEIESRIARAA